MSSSLETYLGGSPDETSFTALNERITGDWGLGTSIFTLLEAPPLLLAAEPLLSSISSLRLETRF
ncbi:MAG: hypothetical protein V7L27_13865 [Nostoc sp.]|uniref:hypothetical protein n=1 Tax=Nostoc sp. TaxID=1180 RepID=UPI002FF4CBD9